ncbi:hypothetical protein KKA39_00505 [Patescibacteria group bacterium]|nr:hypothetical protein [Patescibacteria group bacterium]MBU1727785.1 hypothetical protein [Patescibacteria group bacterium]
MKKIKKIEERTRIYLSHRPRLYALVVGIGIVLFWRGVWHTADLVHKSFNFGSIDPTIGSAFSLWWDGPLSFIVGCVILFFTGAFTSSFIGNELILSGLRGEKKLNQKQEIEIKNEMQSILDMKNGLKSLSEQIEQLEKSIFEKDISHK